MGVSERLGEKKIRTEAVNNEPGESGSTALDLPESQIAEPVLFNRK